MIRVTIDGRPTAVVCLPDCPTRVAGVLTPLNAAPAGVPIEIYVDGWQKGERLAATSRTVTVRFTGDAMLSADIANHVRSKLREEGHNASVPMTVTEETAT